MLGTRKHWGNKALLVLRLSMKNYRRVGHERYKESLVGEAKPNPA